MYQKDRIYYLDWLRVSAFGILILFHSWQPFTNFNWLINSDNKTIIADIFTVFFHTWRLHLIFFVSGIGTWFAMRSSGKHFFYNRFLRLIVPFIFGAIVIVPCQYFYQMLQTGNETGFVDFMLGYPEYILHKDFKFDIFLWILEIGIHIWYLPYLFIMTVLMFPFLKRIYSKGLSDKFIEKLTQRPKSVLLFALPIISILIVLQPIFPEYTSVADFLVFACFFMFGFIFMKEHERLLPVLNKNHLLLLILGIVSSVALIGFLLIEPLREAAFNPKFNLNHLIVSVPLGLTAFTWPLYFVSLFSRKLNTNKKMLPELNRSVLPVYIVHQSIIVVAGFYIIKYIDSGLLEFILMLLTTIVGSYLAYYFIKMFKITRFLFGMGN